MPKNTALRSPSVQEVLEADENCWAIICDLVNVQNASLDEALVHVARPFGEIDLYLRPQLKEDKGDQGPKQRVFVGKRENWAIDLDGKKFCFNFHEGECRFGDSCKFSHRCPILLRDGMPCGGKHMACKCNGKRKARELPVSLKSKPLARLKGNPNVGNMDISWIRCRAQRRLQVALICVVRLCMIWKIQWPQVKWGGSMALPEAPYVLGRLNTTYLAVTAMRQLL